MEEDYVIVAITASLTLYGAMAALRGLRHRAGSLIRHLSRGAYMRQLTGAMDSQRHDDPTPRPEARL